ncbi:MAG: aspartyl protease family protein [Candidatus Eisenbacteria bacterium]|uniref:Aspartyl protease family protein n=1 Tax=Eiseniibacteriota bacterium TaxID=2212470 RepID=A0A956M0F5_UNCEI|nr:aspartyl protease family protein [Candidatus Eisenbacteria bacterium]
MSSASLFRRHAPGLALPLWIVLASLAAAAGVSMSSPYPPETGGGGTGSGIRDAKAQALIDRHVAWLGGWSSLDALQSLRLEGAISVSGLQGTIVDRERRDGYRRTDFDLKVVQGTETVAPEDAWGINVSGQIEDLGTDQAASIRRSIARSFSQHLRGEGVAVSAMPAQEKEGRSWEVVRFEYPNGDLSDLFLDRDGSTTWQREVTDTDTVWNKLSDWRVVDGLRFPFVQESFHEHAAANQTVRWETVTVNPPLPAEEFARPTAGQQVATIDDPSGSTPWMPIELHQGRYVFLQGTVNGEPTDIVLDSGAGITVLDRPTVERLHLETAGSLPAQGVSGRTEAALVQGFSIDIGQVHLAGLTGAVIDLADVNRRVGRDLSVILGKEVFHNLLVEIDYPESRIRFHDPAKFRYTGTGAKVPLTAGEDGHKDLEVSVEDLPPAKVGLDTGSGSTLSIFGAYAAEHDLLAGRHPMSEHVSAGVGGTSVSKVTTVRSITFAGYTLHDVPVSFHDTEVGAFATKRQAGNLGAGILGRFRVYFDYPSECLWVEPGKDWDTAPFERDRSGLQTIAQDGALDVIFVAPGSPAAAGPWKAGDKITAIDGNPVTGDYWKSLYKWSRAEAGTRVRLTTADGEERELVLATYY